MEESLFNHCGYSAGHPWYYVLGGDVIGPKLLWSIVGMRGYRGYRDDIDEVDKKAEPERSEELRRIRAELIKALRRDLSRYRECARELQAYREAYDGEPDCADVHTNMSLKHNHLYNDFGHLIAVDDLLSKQRDLFDF